MVEIIMRGILSFLSPITTTFENVANTILGLIPGLSDYINYVVVYLNNILKFVPLCLDFLAIPRQAIVFLFDYYIIKFSIYLLVRTIKFVIRVYNKFKP